MDIKIQIVKQCKLCGYYTLFKSSDYFDKTCYHCHETIETPNTKERDKYDSDYLYYD